MSEQKAVLNPRTLASIRVAERLEIDDWSFNLAALIGSADLSLEPGGSVELDLITDTAKAISHLLRSASLKPGKPEERCSSAAQLSNAVLATQTVQHDPYFLFGRILPARGSLDILDDLLAGALGCLSHHPLLSDYDEPETLSYQIALFGPISAGVRQLTRSIWHLRRQDVTKSTSFISHGC